MDELKDWAEEFIKRGGYDYDTFEEFMELMMEYGFDSDLAEEAWEESYPTVVQINS